MLIQCSHLTALLNRLYERGDDRFTVAHPSTEVGQLLTVELGAHDDSTIRFEKNRDEYGEARNDVRREYPEQVAGDLPKPDEYIKTVMASGAIPVANVDEIETLLDRYGDPDLMAGHPPVFAGIDTNLMPWRIDEILGLRDPNDGVGYVNGFVLATGIRDELDWDYKCHETGPFEDAFGSAYEEYWNQPLGSARIGRLGLLRYRDIRDIQQAAEIQSESGDEHIVEAYDEYERDRRGQILLFSNDRNFVERARSRTVLSQVVRFPDDLPRETSVSWNEIERLIHLLAIVFGVIELPGVTVHGVWRGKDELDWQHDRLELDCRSTTLEPQLETDLSIVETYEELQME